MAASSKRFFFLPSRGKKSRPCSNFSQLICTPVQRSLAWHHSTEKKERPFKPSLFSPPLAQRLIHLFSWSGLIDSHKLLKDVFKVPNLQTGKMEPMISALTDEEEEQFRNMLKRLETLFRVSRTFGKEFLHPPPPTEYCLSHKQTVIRFLGGKKSRRPFNQKWRRKNSSYCGNACVGVVLAHFLHYGEKHETDRQKKT